MRRVLHPEQLSRDPQAAHFGRHFLVAPYGMNPEAHCEQHALCLAEGSLLCLVQPYNALRIALPRHSTHHPRPPPPPLPDFTYSVGHLLNESASCLGRLTHGLTTPPAVTPCDARYSWASSGSHSGQPLKHSAPLIPRVTAHRSPPTPTAPHSSSPQYSSQRDTCQPTRHTRNVRALLTALSPAAPCKPHPAEPCRRLPLPRPAPPTRLPCQHRLSLRLSEDSPNTPSPPRPANPIPRTGCLQLPVLLLQCFSCSDMRTRRPSGADSPPPACTLGGAHSSESVAFLLLMCPTMRCTYHDFLHAAATAAPFIHCSSTPNTLPNLHTIQCDVRYSLTAAPYAPAAAAKCLSPLTLHLLHNTSDMYLVRELDLQ